MFQNLKKYISVIKKLQEATSDSEISKLKKTASLYGEKNLSKDIDCIPEIVEQLDLGSKFGVYIDFYKETKIPKESIINGVENLLSFVKENYKNIKNTGRLNCYLVSKKKPNIFLHIHYQGEIILIHRSYG